MPDHYLNRWWRHQMEHFPRYWPFVRGIHRSPVNSPHKSQWRGALMFSLSCVWINGWENNREAGDLRRYRAHYGVTVMRCCHTVKQEVRIELKSKWIDCTGKGCSLPVNSRILQCLLVCLSYFPFICVFCLYLVLLSCTALLFSYVCMTTNIIFMSI